MPQTTMLVPKPTTKASFRERVSRALEAVAMRAYTISNLLSSDPKTAQIMGFGGKTDAGVIVNARNAFTFSAVFDAVNQGASDVAKLPLNLLKRKQGGGSEHYVESRTYRLLKDEPNPEMSSMDFRQTLQAHAMTRTGGFAEIERDGFGRPFWLWPITPDRVERLRDGNGPLYYRVDGKDIIQARDMLDIRGLGYDGNCGHDVIDKARQAIGLALAAEKFGSTFFGSGAGFPGLLGIKNAVGNESMETFRKYVDQQYGPGSWNRFLILDNNPTFTPFGVDPDKAQMNELRTKQVEEVARFFNFPVHKLKNLDRATNNNIEQQDLEYYKGFMLNWTTKWEQECNRKLIAPLESRQQFIKHNVNAFLRGDTAARTEFYSVMIDRGIFNADMVLELEDMNPQPNGLGQIFLVNSTMIPKDKLNALADAKLNPPQPPPAPKDPEDDPDDDDGVTQDDVDAADARAAQAEQVASEMRTRAEDAARRVAELEGAAAPSADALVEARARADAETQRANTAELLATETRRLADTVQQQFEAAEAERARLAGALDEERAARGADQTRLEAARAAEAERATAAAAEATAASEREQALQRQLETEAAERARLAAEVEAERSARAEDVTRLQGELAQARTAAAEADTARQQAETAHASILSGLEATVADLGQRERDALARHGAESERVAALTTELEAARQHLADVQGQQQADTDAHAQAVEAQRAAVAAIEARLATTIEEQARDAARLTALSTELDEARQSIEAVRAAEAAAAAARDAAIAEGNARAEGLQAQVAAASDRLQALERELEAERASRQGQVSAEIASHHALVVDIMRRMIERETDRARRAQSTPERLRQWIDAFYPGHEDLLRTALLPAVRIHAAFTASTEAANDIAERLARRHVEESQRQLRTLLDGDADAYAASVPGLLHRWESDRVTTIADLLMQKELDHVRQR